MQSKVHHPVLKWAQRKSKLFLTLELRDLVDEKVDLTETAISFRGCSDKKEYEFSYELFHEVSKEDSKWEKTGFHMRFIFEKKEALWWTRLVKDSKKNPYLQVDWDKWVDEDEEQEEGQKGLGDWNPSAMQGFGGAQDQDEDYDDEGEDGEGEGEEDLYEDGKLPKTQEAKTEEAKTDHVHTQSCAHPAP